LERIVMSLHVNSVSATCGSNLAPFTSGVSSRVQYELMRIGPRGAPSRRGCRAQPDADRHYSCGTYHVVLPVGDQSCVSVTTSALIAAHDSHIPRQDQEPRVNVADITLR
jgi:hypothetical protein